MISNVKKYHNIYYNGLSKKKITSHSFFVNEREKEIA